MVSIFDEKLTRIKDKLHLKVNKNTYTLDVFKQVLIENSDLQMLIPLFYYDEIVFPVGEYNKVLDNKNIITKRNIRELEINSVNNHWKKTSMIFNTFLLDNTVVLLILSDENDLLKETSVDVYVSDDNTDYTFDTTLKTDNHAQIYYVKKNSYVKFKINDEWSNIC